MIKVNSSNDFSATNLISGILGDFQELLRQQFALIKEECLADWRKTKEAGLLLGVSLVPLASGGVLFAFMLVHLLHWATTPAGADPASLPLWVCYLIVGVVLVGVGGVLFMMGLGNLRSMNPLRGQSVQAMEENVHWFKETVDGNNRLAGNGLRHRDLPLDRPLR
jgi:hypothetical protein